MTIVKKGEKMKKNLLEKNIEKRCAVCQNLYMTSVLDLVPCPYCGWYNDSMCEENPDRVIYRNLVSFNKAKKLYTEGKPFEPNLDEFIEALFFYSEVQFEYNGTYYAVELVGKNKEKFDIQLYNSKTGEASLFKTKDDFKNNAKVEGKFLKDIWDETTDRYWLQ